MQKAKLMSTTVKTAIKIPIRTYLYDTVSYDNNAIKLRSYSYKIMLHLSLKDFFASIKLLSRDHWLQNCIGILKYLDFLQISPDLDS